MIRSKIDHQNYQKNNKKTIQFLLLKGIANGLKTLKIGLL